MYYTNRTSTRSPKTPYLPSFQYPKPRPYPGWWGVASQPAEYAADYLYDRYEPVAKQYTKQMYHYGRAKATSEWFKFYSPYYWGSVPKKKRRKKISQKTIQKNYASTVKYGQRRRKFNTNRVLCRKCRSIQCHRHCANNPSDRYFKPRTRSYYW